MFRYKIGSVGMNVDNTMIWFCVLSWSFIIKCSVSINPDRSGPSNNCQINRLWKYPAEFSGSLVRDNDVSLFGTYFLSF